ncbi:MAG: ROK family protein [Anaerolineae bacterium]
MKPYAIGIDVGGSKIAAGVVDQQAHIVARYNTKEHAGRPPEQVIESIEQAYRALLESAQIGTQDIEGVGLGFAGHVHGTAGMVLTSSNLPEWNNVPLRDIVSQRLNVPVILENDTKVCALAEYLYGAGRGAKNMCYVTISTGYGLGIIIDGKLYLGNTGTSGEIGHTVVEVNGAPCPCGKRGCLIAYASGMGLARMAREKIASGAQTLLREMSGGDPERLTGELITEAARRGDSLAKELINTAGYYAGVGLSTVVQVVNPELLVVGGGLTRIGPMFMEPCMRGLKENIHPVLWDSVRVVPWQLGEDGGIIGAAAKVFQQAAE